MPSRNIIKQYEVGGFYHVYNRGVEKRLIFNEEQDYVFFIGLLKRYLGSKRQHRRRGELYDTYYGSVELLAFCLMPNHFHILFYLNHDDTSITELMRKISGSYVSYFNRKYERVGPLFQGIHKASRITADSYLHHISRYIHLNHSDYATWSFSSYQYYIGNFEADWVMPGRVLELFDKSIAQYKEFLDDYIDHKNMIDELKHELADL